MKVRAYSTLTLKDVDEDRRIITGIASTPNTDRMGDIVEPAGAVFKVPLPLLWQHKSDQPIGHVIEAKVTGEGIAITAQIAKGVLPAIDNAWQLIKSGLVRGLSIGFKAIETADIDGTWGQRFIKWEWLELSAVTIPANADASINTIKSIDDAQMRAASGTARNPVHLGGSPRPGVTGKPVAVNPRGAGMKTTAERIAEYEAKRAANTGRMAAIMEKSNEEGSTLAVDQTEEYDTLAGEIKAIDEHLARLRTLDTIQRAQAVEVPASAGTDPAAAQQARNANANPGAVDARGSGVLVQVKRNLPPGTAFARFAQALAFAKGNLMQAHQVSLGRWGDTPEVEASLKAAAAAGTTTSTTWAGPLWQYQTMVSEFVELLRPQTIVGKLQGLRRVPFNVRMASQTQGSTVGWVGQGAPKPVSELAFAEITLGLAKAAGIVVISQELARSSDPSAESIIRQDLIDTMSVFMDQQFIDPAVSAVANVSPASVTNGLTPVQSTGNTIALISTDVSNLIANFINNDIAPKNPYWVMHPITAMALSLKRTAQDIFAFPDITMNGGTFFGIPVITSRSVPKTVSGGSIIVLLDASEIFFADDGQVMLDVSEQASLQMNTAPSAGAQTLVSLWQNNLIGIRAERYMNWKRRRDTAVTYLDNVPVY